VRVPNRPLRRIALISSVTHDDYFDLQPTDPSPSRQIRIPEGLFGEDSVPGKFVAQLMGHAKVDTTPNVNTQVIDGVLQTAVDQIGSELFTIVQNPEKASDLTR
jgi:hypothetical protein